MKPVKYHEAAEDELLKEIGYPNFGLRGSGDVSSGKFGELMRAVFKKEGSRCRVGRS